MSLDFPKSGVWDKVLGAAVYLGDDARKQERSVGE